MPEDSDDRAPEVPVPLTARAANRSTDGNGAGKKKSATTGRKKQNRVIQAGTNATVARGSVPLEQNKREIARLKAQVTLLVKHLRVSKEELSYLVHRARDASTSAILAHRSFTATAVVKSLPTPPNGNGGIPASLGSMTFLPSSFAKNSSGASDAASPPFSIDGLDDPLLELLAAATTASESGTPRPSPPPPSLAFTKRPRRPSTFSSSGTQSFSRSELAFLPQPIPPFSLANVAFGTQARQKSAFEAERSRFPLKLPEGLDSWEELQGRKRRAGSAPVL
ncbi:hypothetical protein JCM11641_000545 [Rhodosporidiobolus odoratus]